MAAWRHRVARDEKGKLHFVCARYDTADPRQRCGMTGIWNEGGTLDDMRQLVRELGAACNDAVINMTEYELEPGEDGDDEDEGYERLSDYDYEPIREDN